MERLSDEHARLQFTQGLVIPAMPLALQRDRTFDPVSQRAVLRYYIDAGVGGIAVGVHSTQFAIRDYPGFYEHVLSFAADTVAEWSARRQRPIVLIAGICGSTDQALEEARQARSAGYHAGLLSLTALRNGTLDQMIEHVRLVAQELPVVGFYLQRAVGGTVLPYTFWRRFAALDNVWGIKVAPFDRYATIEVLRGVADSGRAGEIALYTGNDDTIVYDLLTPYKIQGDSGTTRLRFRGGLLGHWGVWTKRSVELLDYCRRFVSGDSPVPQWLLTRAVEVTDMNGAVFDAAHGYAGCLPGIHTVLHRQGLLQSSLCLDRNEKLSPGQAAEIDRVCRSYPHLTDDEFVRENLHLWRN